MPTHPLPPSLLTEIANRVGPEWFEWYTLTPAERWDESAKLWQTYVALGGSLDPVPVEYEGTMIKNERQYNVTKAQAQRFEDELKRLKKEPQQRAKVDIDL
jgi:hypothetical protein